MIYAIENEFLRVVAETRGAELCSIYDQRSGRENLWQGDPAVWNGRSPLLFPIVGRLKEDAYTYAGRRWPMEQHGFARKMEFALGYWEKRQMSYVLQDSEETHACYPFAFRLTVGYQLSDNVLAVRYTVENPGKDAMYYAIGAHPGFNCTPGDIIEFSEAETLQSLRLNAETHLVMPERLPVLNNERRIALDAQTFDHDALIFPGFRSKSVALVRRDGSRVTVSLGGATCLGFWSMSGKGLPYVCIEPWWGLDDPWNASGKIEEKPLIETLASGGRRVFEIKIVIEG